MEEIFICPQTNCKHPFSPKVSNGIIQCPKCKYSADRSHYNVISGKTKHCAYCGAKWIDYKHAVTERNGIIVCPKCGHKSEITIVNPKKNKNWRSSGVLILQEDPDKKWGDAVTTFSLSEGRNIIGRVSSDGKANIMFNTYDKYMSRVHIEITIKKNTDGTYTHTLRDISTHNNTYINDVRIPKGQLAILEPGSTLKLGHTTFAICDTTTKIVSDDTTGVKTIPE